MYIIEVNLEITICQTSDCLIINVLNKTIYKYIIFKKYKHIHLYYILKIIYLAVLVFAKMELHRYIYITLLCPLIRIIFFSFF